MKQQHEQLDSSRLFPFLPFHSNELPPPPRPLTGSLVGESCESSYSLNGLIG